MSFRDYFKIENAIRIYGDFNIVMGGYYKENKSFLVYNAKEVNGKNAYEELVKEKYLSKIKKYSNDEYFGDFFADYPNLRLMYSKGEYWPCFDYYSFLNIVMRGLIFTSNNEKINIIKSIKIYDVDIIKRKIVTIIKEDRWVVKDSIDKLKNLNPLQLNLLREACKQIKKDKTKDKFQGMEKLLYEYRNYLDKLVYFIDETFETYSNKLDLEQVMNCFDDDKLSLIIVKAILDNSYIIVEETGEIDRMVHIVQCYINAVEKYRIENPEYNPSIIIEKNHKKEKYYTYMDLKKKFGKYLELAPDFKPGYIEEIFTDNEFPWEIISSGNNINDLGNNLETEKTRVYKEKSTEDRDAKALRVVEGFEYLCSNRPISKFKGKDIFDGYIGFQYENGIVIFEKVYDKNGDIAISNATYAMTINNFTYLSKKTKPEIINILKYAKTGLWRFYHTENMISWRNRVDELINGRDYTSSDYDEIEELLNDNKKTL